MSRSIERHRIANKGYHDGLTALRGSDIEIFGDATDTTMYANMASELAKNVGQMVAKKQASDADRKKLIDMDSAKKEVEGAKIELQKADDKERDPSGPVHSAAKDKLEKALAKLNALTGDATGGQAAAAMLAPTRGMAKSGKTPTWVWVAGGVGAAGLILLVAKMIGGRK